MIADYVIGERLLDEFFASKMECELVFIAAGIFSLKLINIVVPSFVVDC